MMNVDVYTIHVNKSSHSGTSCITGSSTVVRSRRMVMRRRFSSAEIVLDFGVVLLFL